MNLYEYLKFRDFRGMSLDHIREISKQLLHSLIYLKKHSIIHCDLKPENILLIDNSKNKDIKVIDFGSSCFENDILYSYIQSRFYRAPEVILGAGYSTDIDMWSFGCIIAELFNGLILLIEGIPIFPGESEATQIHLIAEYLNVPPIELINVSTKKGYFDEFNNLLKCADSKGKLLVPNSKKIEKFLKNSDEKFIDFVKKCLTWDPVKRLKPEEAILHPFIKARNVKVISSKSRKHISDNFIKNEIHKPILMSYKTQINKKHNFSSQIIKTIIPNEIKAFYVDTN